MAAGLALGYTDAFEGDTVSFTDEQLTSIEETLIDFKPNLLGFVHDEETLTQDYQNGNVVVSYANRSTHVGIMNDVENVAFSQPAEEELTWFEGAVVTAGSSNKEAAFRVLNEYLDPDIGAALSETRNIMNTSQAAMDTIETPSLQIEPGVLEGMIPFKPAEQDAVWIEMFERVKNA
jgi:spermidine/putrescine transport system substrate-binding protein